MFTVVGEVLLQVTYTKRYVNGVVDFLPDTFEELKKYSFDLVGVEGTYGYGIDSEAHCNFKKVEEIHEMFLEKNMLKNGGLFCVSHIAPHFTPMHDEIAPAMSDKGITIEYDGLQLNL
jgi:predicted secreted protein